MTISGGPTPTGTGEAGRQHQALDTALRDAIADLGSAGDDVVPQAADYRWLAVGLQLGLQRPGTARRLLDLIGGPDAVRAPSPGGDPGDATSVGDASPVLSALLARAAALPSSERAGLGPAVTFGWAARLTRGQVLALGHAVEDMLAAGAPADIGRGFGLTWDAGVRLPHGDRDAMFREFTALEITVGGVLAGRDLRAEEAAQRPSGLGGLFDQWVTRARPEDTAAATALEGSGERGRRGLVALWNVWVVMRYRSLIPEATFALLTRPWVTVVGPLPAP